MATPAKRPQQAYAPIMGEFVGTMVIAAATTLASGNTGRAVFGSADVGAFAVGFAYLAMTYCFVKVSGAHFNPAISLAALLHKRIDKKAFLTYILFQLLGGLAGAALGRGIAGTKYYNTVGGGFTEGEAFFVEVVFAAILVHVYLLTASGDKERSSPTSGMAVGFTFMGLTAGANYVSGGVFNSAVGLMVDVINNDGKLWWVYLLAPLVGAIIAALVFAFTGSKLASGQPSFRLGGAILFEFFHTGALVLVTSLGGRAYAVTTGSTTITEVNRTIVFALAFFYGGQVYAGAGISGGHCNPAVSLGTFLTQKRFFNWGHITTDHPVADVRVRDVMQLITYWVAQILGAIVGGLVAVRIYPTNSLGAQHPFISTSGRDAFQEFSIQSVFVFFLVLAFLNLTRAVATRGNKYFGLAIALLAVGANAAYGRALITYNPATALGLSLSADADGVTGAGGDLWVFIVPPLLAAAGAAIMFAVTHEDEVADNPSNSPTGAFGLANVRKPLVEFVGTFSFIFTISATAGGRYGVSTALAAGSWLAGAIYTAGAVSGGHLNPAVTLGIWFTRRGMLHWKTVIVYIVSQLAGATLGAVTATSITGQAPFPAPQQTSTGEFHAAVVESMFTALLVFTVLCVATTKANAGNWSFGLAIGSTVVAGAFAAGHLSGGAFNPSVAAGLIFGNGSSEALDRQWLYWLAQVIGAGIAAGAFSVIYEGDDVEDAEAEGAPTPYFGKGLRAFLAEMWGTFYVMFVSAMALPLLTNSTEGLLYAAFAIGAVYLCCTYSLRKVSGGHFNPAVTLATTLATFTTPAQLAIYSFAQILAAVGAGFMARSFRGGGSANAYAPWVPSNDDSFRALSAETALTAVLVVVVLATMHSKTREGNSYYGMCVSAVFTAATIGTFAVSRAALNPAVTGLVLVKGTNSVADDLYLYWLGPLLGALIGAVLFRVSNGQEFNK